jgi:hypothetical protein
MQTKVINPYPFIGAKHKEALDFIIANLPASPTFDNLNEVVVSGIFTPTTSFPDLNDLFLTLLKTVLPNAYNGYVNKGTSDGGRGTGGNMGGTGDEGRGTSGNTGGVNSEWRMVSSNTRYTEGQLVIINKMLQGINRIAAEDIGDFLSGIEENIASAGLSFEEQMPLLMATSAGKSDFDYWIPLIETPGPWAAYLTDNKVFNYLHVAGLVSASVQGALLPYGLVKHPQFQPLDIYSVLIGSVGLAAGKVVMGWTQM